MNLNAGLVRNHLSIQTLSILIFIKVNCLVPVDYKPEIITFNCRQSLSTGHHSSSDRATGKKSEKKNRSVCLPWVFFFELIIVQCAVQSLNLLACRSCYAILSAVYES